jgi:hypothetical protein
MKCYNIKPVQKSFENVKKFKYLTINLTNENFINEDIKSQIREFLLPEVQNPLSPI